MNGPLVRIAAAVTRAALELIGTVLRISTNWRADDKHVRN
jgi:hypothetical protein